MTYTITDGMAVAALLIGMIGFGLNWRQSRLRRRGPEKAQQALEEAQEALQKGLRDEMGRGQSQCLGEIAELREKLTEAEKNAQAGRLGMPDRARALRMLRSGVSAETAAAELGLARNEVQLLEKVAILLAPQN